MITIRTCPAVFLLAGLALSLAACEGLAPLSHPQKIDRADMPLNRIDTAPVAREKTTPANPSAAPEEPGATTMPAAPEEPIQSGTYVFTIPPTVSTVKQTTDGMQQYRLYMGQPKPEATPFLVMTVAPNLDAPTQDAQGEATHRSYRLNGLMTQEWKGYDLTHHPYCELLLAHGTSGDQLHAIAVARNNEERAVALKILDSIKWVASENK